MKWTRQRESRYIYNKDRIFTWILYKLGYRDELLCNYYAILLNYVTFRPIKTILQQKADTKCLQWTTDRSSEPNRKYHLKLDNCPNFKLNMHHVRQKPLNISNISRIL